MRKCLPSSLPNKMKLKFPASVGGTTAKASCEFLLLVLTTPCVPGGLVKSLRVGPDGSFRFSKVFWYGINSSDASFEGVFDAGLLDTGERELDDVVPPL